MNNIEPVIKQIAASCGIEEKNVIVNDLYLQWVLQPSYETIAVCGVLILAIVLFSVAVSYTHLDVYKRQVYGSICRNPRFFVDERGKCKTPAFKYLSC